MDNSDSEKVFPFCEQVRDRAEQESRHGLSLSETDIECLNRAILKCKDKTFNELVDMSHDMAWNNTRKDREMSVKDILRENGESEEYAEYISSKLQEENAF